MSLKERISAANAEAFRRIVAADPILVDVAPAAEVIPGMRDRLILHSGPPVTWDRMCGAQRGAAIGMCLFEGWAADPVGAERALRSGEISLEPNHHHSSVGPMAGTISRNMWVWVVENKTFGNRAFCRQVESFQQFGDYSRSALALLEKWRDVWGPALRAAVRKMGGVPLKQLVARALLMGDGDEADACRLEQIEGVHVGRADDAEDVLHAMGEKRFDEGFARCHARH